MSYLCSTNKGITQQCLTNQSRRALSGLIMKKNTSKQYFVSATETTPVIAGRYGAYARINGYNYSEKQMIKWGFEVRTLTTDEVNAIMAEQKARLADIKANEEAMEMARRAKQVELCLAGEPLAIGEGNQYWTAITKLEANHLEAYTGCGSATAYITDGKIIAWHYGNRRPANAPECDYAQQCEVSCTEILF